MHLAFSCFSKLSNIRLVWYFSLCFIVSNGFQVKFICRYCWFHRGNTEVLMTVCAMNLSKDLYKNKYTKINCWRNLADKFDMSPEDAVKRRGHLPFFSNDHSDHMESGSSLRSLGSPGLLNQFFSDSGDPSNYIWKLGLKNSGENEGRTSTPNASIQLSSEKKIQFLVLFL